MNQSFYTGAVGAGQLTKKLSVISNNLANINNTGFKPKTAVFSELMNYKLNDSESADTELQTGVGARLARTWTDFGTAAVTQTDSQYDYALLDPNAFFMIQDPSTGEITYTRDGHFHRGERDDGFYLVTENGKLVLDQNQQPLQLEVTDVEKLQAEASGESTDDTDDTTDEDDDTDKPKVSAYTFANPSRLLSVGDNEYKPQDEGIQGTLDKNVSVQKGVLENSGTDLAKEMVNVIECQRAFSYAVKMIETSDDIESTINSLRG